MRSATAKASLGRAGDAVLGHGQADLLHQRAKALAVLGQVDGVGARCPGCGTPALGQLAHQLERRLPAELHDHALRLLQVDRC